MGVHVKPPRLQIPLAVKAHRTQAIVSGDGSVTLHDLPFAEGEAVEVIVIEQAPEDAGSAGSVSPKKKN